jgi:hypothetical protein
MHECTRPDRRSRAPRAFLLGVAALTSAALVAACGSGGGSPRVATRPSTTPPASKAPTDGGGSAITSTTEPDNSAQLLHDELRFARCMRANGVPDFPDPSSSGGFELPAGAGNSPETLQAAQARCRKLLPGGGPPGLGTSTHPSAQELASVLKVSQCMRRHGISDWPDPRTSIPSQLPFGVSQITDYHDVILLFPSTIDFGSPAVKRAAATCGFQLHKH